MSRLASLILAPALLASCALEAPDASEAERSAQATSYQNGYFLVDVTTAHPCGYLKQPDPVCVDACDGDASCIATCACVTSTAEDETPLGVATLVDDETGHRAATLVGRHTSCARMARLRAYDAKGKNVAAYAINRSYANQCAQNLKSDVVAVRSFLKATTAAYGPVTVRVVLGY